MWRDLGAKEQVGVSVLDSGQLKTQVKNEQDELQIGFLLKYKGEKQPLIQTPSDYLFILHNLENQSLLWKARYIPNVFGLTTK